MPRSDEDGLPSSGNLPIWRWTQSFPRTRWRPPRRLPRYRDGNGHGYPAIGSAGEQPPVWTDIYFEADEKDADDLAAKLADALDAHGVPGHQLDWPV